MVAVDGSGTYQVNVNVFTEVAVQKLGLTNIADTNLAMAAGTSDATILGKTVTAANDQVRVAIGLKDDIVTGAAPIAVVTDTGAPNTLANPCGKLLAAASGVDVNNGTASTVSTILAQLDDPNPVLATATVLLAGANNVVNKVPSFLTTGNLSLSDYFFIAVECVFN